jgi:hypothetical protein
METIISTLFAARDAAHILHLKTRSFAAHLALGDLYDKLVELADDLAEIHLGKYAKYGGLAGDAPAALDFTGMSALQFIEALANWAESAKGHFNPADTHMLNEWDNVISTIYRAKYKLENLA